MLTIAELDIWPALSTYFGFLKLGSGRAWFLFFISTLCLSGSLSRHQGSIDHILLTVAGICGIILAILGLIIRNEPAVLSRSPADVPAGVANVFKRGERGEAAPTSGNPDQVI